MRIGEVSHRSGVSVRMLRHYDSLGLVSPSSRTTAGYREYADADLRRILHVEALRSLGMGLAEVAEALAGSGVDDRGRPDRAKPSEAAKPSDTVKPSDSVKPSEAANLREPADILGALIDRTRARITAEQELLTRLEHTRARSPDDWADVLDTVALLRAVRSDDPRTRHDAAFSPSSLPAAVFAEAALTEDEPNVAGALRWAADHATGNPTAVLEAAAHALRTQDAARRLRAVQLLGDQFRHAVAATVDPSAEVTDDVSAEVTDDDSAEVTDDDSAELTDDVVDERADHRIDPAIARTATVLLTSALTDEDAEVRSRAALTLASRPRETRTSDPDDVSDFQVANSQVADSHLRDLLVQMIVDGIKDVEAAEALARLTAGGERAADGAAASAAVDAIRDRLENRTTPAAGRVRLVQALGELPASTAGPALAVLTADGDPDVARVATYLVRRGEHPLP